MPAGSTAHLNTARLQLRPMAMADAENVHVLHSLPETDRYNTLGIPAGMDETLQLVTGWVSTMGEAPCKKYVFCIENRQGVFIGLAGINIGAPAYRRAEIWYKLLADHWNNGYATEAMQAALEFCFGPLALHRVEAGCATENAASIRVLEKLGFTREGQCRKILPIRGGWSDNYEFAILEEDHFGRREAPNL